MKLKSVIKSICVFSLLFTNVFYTQINAENLKSEKQNNTFSFDVDFQLNNNIAENDNVKTKSSYIYKNDDETFTLVHASDRVYFIKLDKFLSPKKIDSVIMELPLFGGYYSYNNYHYLVFGQENPDSQNDTEVYRISKYNSSFEKLNELSIYGRNCQTITPFKTGGVSIDRNANLIVINDVRTQYRDRSYNGNVYQTNLTIYFNAFNMKLQKIGNINTKNYFTNYNNNTYDQFVKYVDEEKFGFAGIGDESPRGVFVSGKEISSENNIESQIKVMDIFGEKGNYIGASLGGFEISKSNYILAGNSVNQDEESNENSVRNIFINVLPIGQLEERFARTTWITDYKEKDKIIVSPPKLVKIDDNEFIIMWKESKENKNDYIKFGIIDGSGKLKGNLKSLDYGNISSCQPIVDKNKIIWYCAEKNNKITVYTFDYK